MSINISFDFYVSFNLIGIDAIKLVFNYLNKHNVVTFIKCSKLLYYNKNLRNYVMTRFATNTDCLICDYNCYNIEQTYIVSIYEKKNRNLYNQKGTTCIKFRQNFGKCEVCDNKSFNTIVVTYQELMNLLNLIEHNFTKISNIKEYIKKSKFVKYLYNQWLKKDCSNINDKEIITIINNVLTDIYKNFIVSEDNLAYKFIVEFPNYGKPTL